MTEKVPSFLFRSNALPRLGIELGEEDTKPSPVPPLPKSTIFSPFPVTVGPDSELDVNKQLRNS